MRTLERMNVLLTGGTGFIGKAVLARLVDAPCYDKIYLLVRPNDRDSPQGRVSKTIAKIFPAGRHAEINSRVIAVEGDIKSPRMGIDSEIIAGLTRDLHQILHVGASTDFGLPLAESRLTNVEGTRNCLELALHLRGAGILRRFDYVSTAYVAGKSPGKVTEADLARGQEFANPYEQSKFEAEVLVREYRHELPTAIYRPSIVVGDSKHGYTPHFKVLYWPLLLLAKNVLPFFAVNQRAHLDVVPVDFVADALVALMQRDSSIGETYQLTAGRGFEINIRELLRDSYQYAEVKRRPIVPLWMFRVAQHSPIRTYFHENFWTAVDMAKPYFAYLNGTGVRFESEATHSALRSLGVEPPRWADYKREVLGYCSASRWGKKPPMPEYVYYLPASLRRPTTRKPAVFPQIEVENLSQFATT